MKRVIGTALVFAYCARKDDTRVEKNPKEIVCGE